MKKIILILALTLIILLPIRVFAQDVIDILDQLINEGTMEEDFEAMNPSPQDEDINLKSIDLVWSADSYVPYDYPGRALAPEGGFITVEAVLETEGGNQANLQYSWFVDDRFEEIKSGYGKKRFTFGVRRMANATHTVLVKIFNESNSFYIEKQITIPLIAPEIIVYTYGGNAHFSTLSRSNVIVSSDKKMSFIARPFFFSIKKMTDLIFDWRIANNKISATSANNSILDVKMKGKEDKKELDESLSLKVSNKSFVEQDAFKSVNLKIF